MHENQPTTDTHVYDWVDLAQYPIDKLDSPQARAFIDECKAKLADSNSCVLPSFVKVEALGALQQEAKTLARDAFFYEKGGLNCYRTGDDPRYPTDHPRRLFYEVKEGVVAYDQFAEDSSLKRVYLWQPLADFLARVFGKGALYPFGDPFQALNIMVLRENPSDMGMGWHFDENEFTVTLMIQPPEAGGEFEFVPNIRGPWDENYQGVQAILRGGDEGVRRVSLAAGTLALFRGGFSLHRVAPVTGQTDRLQCIMTFEKEPEQRASEESSINIYGPRVAAVIAKQKDRTA